MPEDFSTSRVFIEVASKLLETIPARQHIGDESLEELLIEAEHFVTVVKENIAARESRVAKAL